MTLNNLQRWTIQLFPIIFTGTIILVFFISFLQRSDISTTFYAISWILFLKMSEFKYDSISNFATFYDF